jgi:hypothetical protein
LDNEVPEMEQDELEDQQSPSELDLPSNTSSYPPLPILQPSTATAPFPSQNDSQPPSYHFNPSPKPPQQSQSPHHHTSTPLAPAQTSLSAEPLPLPTTTAPVFVSVPMPEQPSKQPSKRRRIEDARTTRDGSDARYKPEELIELKRDAWRFIY